jgi:hypothetical protein
MGVSLCFLVVVFRGWARSTIARKAGHDKANADHVGFGWPLNGAPGIAIVLRSDTFANDRSVQR